MHEKRDGDTRDDGEGGGLLAEGKSNNLNDSWCSMDWYDCATISHGSHTLVLNNHGPCIRTDTIHNVQIL